MAGWSGDKAIGTKIKHKGMNMESFLPEDYEAPKNGGGYMKIQKGENKIRILSKPIIGWEEWTKEKKPVRYRHDNKPETSISPKEPLRHFWAFIVWNYNDQQIQVLHVTQAGIRKGIELLIENPDWGQPFYYDIKIIKEGEEMKTKYHVSPVPHKPVAVHIIEAFKARPCKLEAIFDNDDPFAEWSKYTPGIFSDEKMEIKQEDIITAKQAQELNDILNNCDPSYKKVVMESISKPPRNVKDLTKLPANLYQILKKAALEKMAEYQASMNNEQVDWIIGA
jgi:hypothetical protein